MVCGIRCGGTMRDGGIPGGRIPGGRTPGGKLPGGRAPMCGGILECGTDTSGGGVGSIIG